MKRSTISAIVVAVLAMAASTVFGASDTSKANVSAPKELHNQTNCPVMGGAIDSAAYTDIQGQRVYHCCPMCSTKLKADPDKYFNEAAAQGVLFQNIQTTCPVCGMKLENKTISADYQGRRLYFCSSSDRDKFLKDPAAYLKTMDRQSAPSSDSASDQSTDQKTSSANTEHSGHSH